MQKKCNCNKYVIPHEMELRLALTFWGMFEVLFLQKSCTYEQLIATKSFILHAKSNSQSFPVHTLHVFIFTFDKQINYGVTSFLY